MKKKKSFILISAVLSAVLFASCSTSMSTNFSANWYENTGNNTVAPGTNETLVYNVEKKADSGLNSSYSVEYQKGTYTTTLSTEQRANEDGKTELFYSYQTKLEISVQFLFGAEVSEVFNDVLTSKVLFRSTQLGLQPIYSEKEVYSHSPINIAPSSLEGCYAEYHYKVVTEYRDKCTAGTATLTDLSEENGTVQTTNFSISDDYSYIDNEELLFAIRGMSLTTSEQLLVYNASTESVQTVKVVPAEEADDEFEFEVLDENESGSAEDNNKRTITYRPVSIAINATNPGATQTAYYAKTVAATNNTWRNVMLKLETPISYNLGTLVYTLKSASFAK